MKKNYLICKLMIYLVLQNLIIIFLLFKSKIYNLLLTETNELLEKMESKNTEIDRLNFEIKNLKESFIKLEKNYDGIIINFCFWFLASKLKCLII